MRLLNEIFGPVSFRERSRPAHHPEPFRDFLIFREIQTVCPFLFVAISKVCHFVLTAPLCQRVFWTLFSSTFLFVDFCSNLGRTLDRATGAI